MAELPLRRDGDVLAGGEAVEQARVLERAAHAALDSIKESWLRIANCYRETAEQNIRMQ